MATVSHAVDGTPTALAGLVDGTWYLLENVGGSNLLIFSGAAAPGATDYGHLLEAGEAKEVKPVSGQHIYVWCQQGSSVAVTTEAE